MTPRQSEVLSIVELSPAGVTTTDLRCDLEIAWASVDQILRALLADGRLCRCKESRETLAGWKRVQWVYRLAQDARQ